MCGRYVSPEDRAIEAEFNLVNATWTFPPSFNVAPTQDVPVIRTDREGHIEAKAMKWGLIPFFARGVPPKYSTINATIEKLTEAATWRGPWSRGQRCILPASGFYEWQVLSDGKSKQPYYITCGDQPIFGFAGLWDSSTTAEGAKIHSCTIITLPANQLMAQIHNVRQRMPAILSKEDREAWLKGDHESAFKLLKPYPDELLIARPVSTRVNAPKNNDPQLIDTVAA